MSAALSPFAIGGGACTSDVHNRSLVFPSYWLQALLDRIEAGFLHAVRTSLVINSFAGTLRRTLGMQHVSKTTIAADDRKTPTESALRLRAPRTASSCARMRAPNSMKSLVNNAFGNATPHAACAAKSRRPA
jgi:hypothetical protein